MTRDEQFEKYLDLCDRIYRRLVAEGQWPWEDSRESETHDRFQEHTPNL